MSDAWSFKDFLFEKVFVHGYRTRTTGYNSELPYVVIIFQYPNLKEAFTAYVLKETLEIIKMEGEISPRDADKLGLKRVENIWCQENPWNC